MSTSSETKVCVRLLGGVWVTGPAGTTALRSRMTAQLLARLALAGDRTLRREVLIEALFPDLDADTGRARLRQTLYLLRQELDAAGASADEVIIADREMLRLAGELETDVGRFTRALDRARAAPQGRRRESLSGVVDGYGGELLPGHFDDWTLRERERLAEQYARALCNLVEELLSAGAAAEAVERARQAFDSDPLREESSRCLMQALAAAGRPADAERHYRSLERLLQDQLGLEPAVETRTLREQIRKGERPQEAMAPKSLPDSPPATAPPRPVSRVPRPVTRLYGRAEELARVERWLAGDASPGTAPNPLVTLTGPGGIGKTRVALELAHRLQKWFAGSVWFVPLEGVSGRKGLVDALLGALGERPGTPARLEVLEECLHRPSGALLVLDNFEGLVDEAALLLQDLRTRVPGLACLVTSRQRLRLRGEQELVLGPLALPGPDGDPEGLEAYPGVQLFLERVRSARASFQLTPENSEEVRALCRRLDGLPLALELGAAWLGVLSPRQALERLADGAALVSRDHDAPPRHRSLEAALDSSYRLLAPAPRELFRRLSVFRGGWTLEAAEAVCGADSSVLEDLSLLVERSLVQVDDAEGEVRYRFLETVREYASRLASETGEERGAAASHAQYFHRIATEMGIGLDRPERDVRIAPDFENCRIALARLCTQPEMHEQALELAGALGCFCWAQARRSEGLSLVAQALDAAAPASTRSRMEALYTAGILAQAELDEQRARAFLDAARVIAESIADARVSLRIAYVSAVVAFDKGDLGEAERWIGECRRLYDGEPVWEMLIAFVSGRIADRSADWVAGRDALRRCVTLAREQKRRRNLGDALVGLGWTYRHDRPDEGLPFAMEGCQIHREDGRRVGEADALVYVGGLSMLTREREGARETFRRALAAASEMKLKEVVIQALAGLGAIEAEQGNSRAGLLFGAADAADPQGVYGSLDLLNLPPVAAARDDCIARFPGEYREGLRLSIGEAVRLALRDEPPTAR